MNKSVSNLQIFFLLVLTIVAYTSVSLPSVLAESSKTGAWFTLAVGTCFFLLPVALITSLGVAFRGKTLFEYSGLLVGKPLSYVFGVVYTIYFACILSLVTRGAAEIIKADFLPRTPIPAIIMIMLIPAAFAASKGISDLGKIFTFFGVLVLISALFLHTIMFSQGHILNLLPLYKPENTMAYLKGTLGLSAAFLGYETLTAVPLPKNSGKRTFMATLGAIVMIGFFYTVIVESCYSIIGLTDIVNYSDPLIIAIRRLDIEPLQFLKRLDIIFILSWLFAVFCTLSLLLFAFHTYIGQVIPRFKRGNTIPATTAIIFIASTLPKDLEMTNKLLSLTTNTLGSLTAFLIPAILFVAMKVTKRHETGS